MEQVAGHSAPTRVSTVGLGVALTPVMMEESAVHWRWRSSFSALARYLQTGNGGETPPSATQSDIPGALGHFQHSPEPQQWFRSRHCQSW